MSAAEVIGPTLTATLPTASRGSQCSAKIRLTPDSAPAATVSIAPPGISSSAGWKISRKPTGSSGARGQRERRAEQDRGVRVVPAGVRHIRHRRCVGGAGPLGHRQRVHVGPQRDPGLPVGAEIAGQSRPAGQHLGFEPGVDQPLDDELRGGEFLAAQLRVAVQMPPPVDEVLAVGGQPGVRDLRKSHDAARFSSAASTRSRCSGDSASPTTVRASITAPSSTALSALGEAAAAVKAA